MQADDGEEASQPSSRTAALVSQSCAAAHRRPVRGWYHGAGRRGVASNMQFGLAFHRRNIEVGKNEMSLLSGSSQGNLVRRDDLKVWPHQVHFLFQKATQWSCVLIAIDKEREGKNILFKCEFHVQLGSSKINFLIRDKSFVGAQVRVRPKAHGGRSFSWALHRSVMLKPLGKKTYYSLAKG